jgi:inosose dehydratase
MIQYGYQINSWHGIMPPKRFWEQSLTDLANAGFDGIELMDVKTEAFRVPAGREEILATFGSQTNFLDDLEEKHLKVCGEYFWQIKEEPICFHDTSQHAKIVEAAIETAQWLEKLEADNLVIGPTWRYLVDEVTTKHLEATAACFNKIGKAVLEYGVKASIHNHHACMVDTRKEIDLILEQTDPEYFWFAPDTAQMYVTGVGVYDTMREYGDRIGYIHLKDAKEVLGIKKEWEYDKQYFWDLGTGKVDFTAVTRLLKDINYEGWITIECDGTKQPGKSAQVNMRYIEEQLKPILK